MKKSVKAKVFIAMLKLLKTKPLNEITVKELVAEAGINRSSYHYHFYCLEDVVDELLDYFFEGLGQTLMEKWENNSENPISNLYPYLYEHRDFIETMNNAGYESAMASRTIELLRNSYSNSVMTYVDENGREVKMQNGTKFDFKANIAAYQGYAIIKTWYDLDYPVAPENMSEYAIGLVNLRIKRIERKDIRKSAVLR